MCADPAPESSALGCGLWSEGPHGEGARVELIEHGALPPSRLVGVLHLKIPVDVHAAFSARAGEEFGFTSGSKTKLFLAMWDAYQRK